MKHLPSLYTFGSMSLGRDPVSPEADVAVARQAMEAGVWFHASRTYHNGFAFMVLRLAFDADRSRVPRMILKIRDGSVPLMRFETEDSCRRLGLESIDIAQLVSMRREPGNLVDQLRANEGPLVEELVALRDRGLIQKTALFLDRQNAEAAAEAARNPLVDAVTFYASPWQFDCTPAAWRTLVDLGKPLLALRTLGGWNDERLADRREAVARRFPNHDPVQLALDFAAALPGLQTTIGGTASTDHLRHYLRAASNATPMQTEPLEFFLGFRPND